MKDSLNLLVDQIINFTHQSKIKEAKFLEQEIDEIVYSIYNLDIEERLVINDTIK